MFLRFLNFTNGAKSHKASHIHICSISKFSSLLSVISDFITHLNPFRPNPERRGKIKLNFHFTLLCGGLKGFMKTSKAPQRSVKIKI